MNEEKNYEQKEAADIFARLERYAQKLPCEEQTRFYHAGIAGCLSRLNEIFPKDSHEGVKKIVQQVITYHLEKAGLEAKIAKEEDKLQPKGGKEKQKDLPYAQSKPVNESYDNPATDVPLGKPSGASGPSLADDDIPF